MKLIYPACFYLEETGQYSVIFPDFNNTGTYGNDLNDALDMAVDFLGCCLLGNIERGEEIPKPSEIKTIKPDNDNGFVTLVSIDLTEYERLNGNKAVKKTLTLPAWLNTLAEKNNINFSALLQQAIKDYLDI